MRLMHPTGGMAAMHSRYQCPGYAFVESIDAKVILIGGRMLAELMIDYGLGTTSTAKYEIRRVDSDYFTEE